MDKPYDPGVRYKTGRDALTSEELELVLRSTTTYEDHLLLEVAVATGIRREDLVAVERGRVEALDTSPGAPAKYRINFWESKRRRTWRVIVAGRVAEDLRRHLSRLRSNDRWLFPGRQEGGGHISGKTAWNVLDRALKRAGLKPRPFHALRATCMKLCQKRGWTIEQTMELTGDSWRTVQEHYLTPSEDELIAVATEKPIVPPDLPAAGGGA